MNASFDLNHDKLAADSKFATFARSLSTQSRIDSRDAFNRYCRKACLLWSEHFSNGPVGMTALFPELLDRINRCGEGTIQTAWGGVVIVLHQHPRVEKYLVIRQGGYLALEMHEQKDEHLEVQEGAGLILCRNAADQPLTVRATGFILSLEWSIVWSGQRTCSCSRGRSIPRGWTRTSFSSTNRTAAPPEPFILVALGARWTWVDDHSRDQASVVSVRPSPLPHACPPNRSVSATNTHRPQ